MILSCRVEMAIDRVVCFVWAYQLANRDLSLKSRQHVNWIWGRGRNRDRNKVRQRERETDRDGKTKTDQLRDKEAD